MTMGKRLQLTNVWKTSRTKLGQALNIFNELGARAYAARAQELLTRF